MSNITDANAGERNAQKKSRPPHNAFPAGSINLAIAVFAALIWWRQAARDSIELNLLGDFVYFWQAGRMWATGQSPYLADYITAGAERFSIFGNPFFYPLNSLPFLSLMAPLSPCAALCWALFVLPSHSTDFILLLPAAAYLFSSTSLWGRIMIGIALLILGRSWNLAGFLTPPDFDQAITVGLAHTIVFSLLLVGLCRAAFQVHPASTTGDSQSAPASYAPLSAA